LLKLTDVGAAVDEGKLYADGTVKVIEPVAVVFKYLRFVLILGELVVDVLKLHCFCKQAVIDPADTVAVHFPVGDTLLNGLRGFAAEQLMHHAARFGIGRLGFSRHGAQLRLIAGGAFCGG